MVVCHFALEKSFTLVKPQIKNKQTKNREPAEPEQSLACSVH